MRDLLGDVVNAFKRAWRKQVTEGVHPEWHATMADGLQCPRFACFGVNNRIACIGALPVVDDEQAADLDQAMWQVASFRIGEGSRCRLLNRFPGEVQQSGQPSVSLQTLDREGLQMQSLLASSVAAAMRSTGCQGSPYPILVPHGHSSSVEDAGSGRGAAGHVQNAVGSLREAAGALGDGALVTACGCMITG